MSTLPSRESFIPSSVSGNLIYHHNTNTDVEVKLSSFEAEGPNDETVAILRACNAYLPEDGRSNLATDIILAASASALKQLADNLRSALLLPMAARCLTPAVIPSPRFNVADDADEIASEFEGQSSRNDQAWLKKACLARDGGKCVVTGMYDDSIAYSRSMPADILTVYTEAAHIIPFSVVNAPLGKSEHIRSALYRYFPRLRSIISFNLQTINDPSNALTMWASFHEMFGKFLMSFEATGTENCYRIETYSRFLTIYKTYLPSDRIVRFVAHDPHHRLPSPLFLEVHACIARILNATGMGEDVRSILREGKELGGLASDGSTNLSRLLSVY